MSRVSRTDWSTTSYSCLTCHCLVSNFSSLTAAPLTTSKYTTVIQLKIIWLEHTVVIRGIWSFILPEKISLFNFIHFKEQLTPKIGVLQDGLNSLRDSLTWVRQVLLFNVSVLLLVSDFAFVAQSMYLIFCLSSFYPFLFLADSSLYFDTTLTKINRIHREERWRTHSRNRMWSKDSVKERIQRDILFSQLPLFIPYEHYLQILYLWPSRCPTSRDCQAGVWKVWDSIPSVWGMQWCICSSLSVGRISGWTWIRSHFLWNWSPCSYCIRWTHFNYDLLVRNFSGTRIQSKVLFRNWLQSIGYSWSSRLSIQVLIWVNETGRL